MNQVVLTGTGLFTPEQSISNEELVESFNAYVEKFNAENAAAIEAGEIDALAPSSAPFIEKASGIKNRFVVDKEGILNPDIMAPQLDERPNDAPSLLAEMGVKAAQQALEEAQIEAVRLKEERGESVPCRNH